MWSLCRYDKKYVADISTAGILFNKLMSYEPSIYILNYIYHIRNFDYCMEQTKS